MKAKITLYNVLIHNEQVILQATTGTEGPKTIVLDGTNGAFDYRIRLHKKGQDERMIHRTPRDAVEAAIKRYNVFIASLQHDLDRYRAARASAEKLLEGLE
jgi:hypothetical protein